MNTITKPQMAPSTKATHLNGMLALMILCCMMALNFSSHCCCKSLFKWVLNSLMSNGKSRANSSINTSFNSSMVLSPINMEIIGSLALNLCLKKSSNLSLMTGFIASKGSLSVNSGISFAKLICPIH